MTSTSPGDGTPDLATVGAATVGAAGAGAVPVSSDAVAAGLLVAGASPRVGRDMRPMLVMVVTVVALLVIWHLLPTLGLVNPLVLPTPIDTADSFGVLVGSDFFWGHLWATVVGVVVAFAIGSALGFAVGAALALNTLLRRTLSGYIYAFQALPKVVLAPLFMAWLGFGPSSKIATAVAICFFPVLFNTTIGLQSASAEQIGLMRSLGASRTQILRKVQLPGALPLIFVGLKNTLLLAFTGTLIAEILIGGGDGLGTLVQLYNRQIAMSLVFAIVAVVAVLSLILIVVFERLDRKFVFWRQAA